MGKKLTASIGMVLFGLFLMVQVVQAQISGTIFRDYDGNGVRGSGIPNIEPGVGGIIVNAYDVNNSIVSTTVSLDIFGKSNF